MASLSKFAWIEPTNAETTSSPFDAQTYTSIDVAADNLSVGETVTIMFLAGNIAKQVTLLDSTPVNLTATLSGVTLEGGVQYVFVKSVTSLLCGVYVYPKLL
jgi:hypothetical protein